MRAAAGCLHGIPAVARGTAVYGGLAPAGIDNVVYGGGPRYARRAYVPAAPGYGPPPMRRSPLRRRRRVPVAYAPPPRVPVAYAPTTPMRR